MPKIIHQFRSDVIGKTHTIVINGNGADYTCIGSNTKTVAHITEAEANQVMKHLHAIPHYNHQKVSLP